jgi:hypothetical protein
MMSYQKRNAHPYDSRKVIEIGSVSIFEREKPEGPPLLRRKPISLPQISKGHVTNFSPHEALKLMT